MAPAGRFSSVAAVLLAILVASCTSLPVSDSARAASLVGRWVEVRETEGVRHEQIINLEGDGSFVVTGARFEGRVVTPFAFSGLWEVRDGHFWYKSLSSEPADIFPVGEELKDRIVSISDTRWVMHEASTGQESQAWRYPQK